jgi:hypothetical protein
LSLFVLIAGPGVLYGLKRTNQMQLFFIVVPLVAMVACLSLIGYVILAEGFDSYGRVQSVTWLDQNSQAAVTQTRAIYYHGLRPQPYRYQSQEAPVGGIFPSDRPCILWQENGAIDVYGGSIQPRVPHAMVGLSSYELKANARLMETEVADRTGEKEYRIVNQLGARVECIVFRTVDGFFIGENIEDRNVVRARAIAEPEARSKVGNLIGQHSPMDYRTLSQSGEPIPSYNLDSELGVVENLRSMVNLESLLPPGSYLAIMSEFSTVESRLQPAQFLNRLHLVIGR